jgi:hypothetical protein
MFCKDAVRAFNSKALRQRRPVTGWRGITAIVGGMVVLVLAAGTSLAQKTLLVMENPGDFSQLVETKTIDEPEDSLFSFQNELPNVVGARWQLSSRPIPSNDLSSSRFFLGFLGSGAFQPPAQGKGKIISVNWKHLVPAKSAAGTKYYFRVVSYQGTNTNPILASNTASSFSSERTGSRST